ncbi:hypothetical protein, partial [Salmonella sp. s54925]|uniref:hypothetical protein n=1 Tax=Salmonella sp. s54925 TaxID=3159674 RepID=UPI003980589E
DSVDFKTSNLAVSLKINSKFSHDFTITKANKMVLQRLEIPQKLIPNQLDVTATGTGCALIQTSVKYNIPDPVQVPAFEVKVDVHPRRLADEE